MSKLISDTERDELRSLARNLTKNLYLTPDYFIYNLFFRLMRCYFSLGSSDYSKADFNDDLKFLCKLILNILEAK